MKTRENIIEEKPREYKIKTKYLFIVVLGVGILGSLGLGLALNEINNLEKTVTELNTQVKQQSQILEQYKQELREKQLHEQKDLIY